MGDRYEELKNRFGENGFNPDYKKARELGLVQKLRWEFGIPHHPMSLRLMSFLADHDFIDHDDSFGWNMGGDGDNGESLMFQMDAFFEMLDKEKPDEI